MGLIFILSHESKVPGIILLIIGGALYVRDFFNLDFNFWQVFWPAMLIIAGVLIIFRRKVDHSHWEKKSLSDDDLIDEISIFGGAEKTVMSQSFKGGKILAIFGGSTFNLVRAKLAPEKNYIEVLIIFGGMKLIVPEDWTVKIRVMSLFGGFGEKLRYKLPETGVDQGSQLIIKGTVIFGGGEIKRYFD